MWVHVYTVSSKTDSDEKLQSNNSTIYNPGQTCKKGDNWLLIPILQYMVKALVTIIP